MMRPHYFYGMIYILLIVYSIYKYPRLFDFFFLFHLVFIFHPVLVQMDAGSRAGVVGSGERELRIERANGIIVCENASPAI